MSWTATESYTYSETDVDEVVGRHFRPDLKMIVNSSRVPDKDERWADDTAQDIAVFCKRGLLDTVDITLLDGMVEVKAVRYKVNRESGELQSSRPGGVLWPSNLATPQLVLTLEFRSAQDARTAFSLAGLRKSWGPSSFDTSHAELNASDGRKYTSGAFGFMRTDYSR